LKSEDGHWMTKIDITKLISINSDRVFGKCVGTSNALEHLRMSGIFRIVSNNMRSFSFT
jgi:hypothetical protein